MLQQLAINTGAQSWVIASMLLFVAVFALVALKVFKTPEVEHRAHANIPLSDDDPSDSDDGQRARR